MPAIDDQGDVDIDDIAFAQRFFARHPVADHMVDRSAGGIAVAAIIERCRGRAIVAGKFINEAVEFSGGHAGFDHGNKQVEHFGGQRAGLAHAGEAFLAVQRDDTGHAFLLGRRFDVGGHCRLLLEAKVIGSLAYGKRVPEGDRFRCYVGCVAQSLNPRRVRIAERRRIGPVDIGGEVNWVQSPRWTR